MLNQFFNRGTRNINPSDRRRRSAVRVEALESRRLFAADAFSINEPPPPVEGPSDLAAEVATVAGEGNDLLIGGDGADVLPGGAGNDVLLGGRENDVVLGQDGNDLLIVNNGDGSDFLEGQTGSDLLIVNNGDGTPDIITSAGPGGGPHVRVFDGSTSQ